MNGKTAGQRWLPYAMLLPALLLVSLFRLYPIARNLASGMAGAGGGLTLGHFRDLFAEEAFWDSLAATLKMNAVMIPFQTAFSFLMSLAANRAVRGSGLVRSALYLPFCVSLSTATVMWKTFLNGRYGIVNSLLGLFGVSPVNFLTDRRWAWLAIILIASWRGCAYWMMFLLAGLQQVDPAVTEAARIDGAGPLVRLFRVVIPCMRHTVVFVLVANTTANLLLFAPVQMTTRGGPEGSTNVLMYEAYKSVFRYSDRARGACIVTCVLLMTAAVSLLERRLLRDGEE